MIDFTYVPVPSNRVLDVFRFLATEASTPESGASAAIEHATTPVPALVARRGRPPGKQSKYRYPCSPVKLERAKAAVKRLDSPFAKIDLQRAMKASAPTTQGAIERMVDQGWLKDEGYARRGKGQALVHHYRYLPAPETPQPKQEDSPLVTGRGKITTNGVAPVPGTGKRDTLRGDIGRLVSVLRKQGWTVERTGGDHFKATHRGMDRGSAVFLPSTPSDPRSVANARAELRRYGANV